MGEPIAEVGYLAGGCQYTGTEWVKSNLLWGYKDRWYEAQSGTSTGTDDILQSDPVDEGYVHVLMGVTCQQVDVNGIQHQVRLYTEEGGYIYLEYLAASDKSDWATYWGEWPMKEGDYVQVEFLSMASGKTMRLRVWGYKMKIDM